MRLIGKTETVSFAPLAAEADERDLSQPCLWLFDSDAARFVLAALFARPRRKSGICLSVSSENMPTLDNGHYWFDVDRISRKRFGRPAAFVPSGP